MNEVTHACTDNVRMENARLRHACRNYLSRDRNEGINLDINRLCVALSRDRYVLRRFREERTRAVRLYLGGHWSDEAGYEKQPVNLISLYCQIVGRGLIAKDPRVMLSTFDPQSKPVVSAMETWANRALTKMRFANTMRRVVLDALFSIGICKVALATPQDAASLSWKLGAGQPFAERVDLDDFVFDVHARDFTEVSYIGHRYRVPLDAIRDDQNYSSGRKSLQPSTDSPYNLEGDEKISALGRMPYAVDSEEFEDWADLWEIYLPRERKVITLHDDLLSGASTSGMGEALREQPWIGRDSGPYHILGYMAVPGNAMPKGPLQDLIDLHEMVNNAYRKLGRETHRLKELLLVAGGAMEDATRINQANDGDSVRNDNPERSKIFTWGGPNEALTRIAVHFTDTYMKLAGNLEMLGGLAPQSKTLGQDELLANNASGGMQDMQQQTVGFTAEVIESLCWYWHHHPTLTMKTKYDLPGLPGQSMPRQVNPGQRMQVPWEELDLEVDPYSFQYKTPQARAQALTQVVQNIILPMMPFLQQAGRDFDVGAFLDKLGKYGDQPDLQDLVGYQGPPPAQSETEPGGPTDTPAVGPKPPQTTRNYVRRSLGGDTPDNRLATLMQGVSGNGQQNKNGTGGQ